MVRGIVQKTYTEEICVLKVLPRIRHHLLVTVKDEEDGQAKVDRAENSKEGREPKCVDRPWNRHWEKEAKCENCPPENLTPAIAHKKVGQFFFSP